MVSSADYDAMTWQRVHMEQQGADYSFDLARLVGVCPFFAHAVKFVEEQHTGSVANVVHDFL